MESTTTQPLANSLSAANAEGFTFSDSSNVDSNRVPPASVGVSDSTTDVDSNSTDSNDETFTGSDRDGFIKLRTKALMFSEVSLKVIKERLKDENQRLCQPPLSDNVVEDLVEKVFTAVVRTGTPNGNAARYLKTSMGLHKQTGIGDNAKLTRITTFIVPSMRKVVFDDGDEQRVSYELEAKMGNRSTTAVLSTDEFARMQWPMQSLGIRATVLEKQHENARVAIQLTATEAPDQIRYTSTGWYKVEGKWMYLHAGGAISTDGAVAGIKATLSRELQRFVLPAPPNDEEQIAAIRASLGVLNIAKDSSIFPLYAATWRAPLPPYAAMTVFTHGPTGQRKTAISMVQQQHFGKDFDEEHVPHFSNTANANIDILHEAKDALLLVDEYVPQGSTREVNKLQSDADTVLRSVANQQGRSRLTRDGKRQSARAPRGLALATGEARVVGRQSLSARTIYNSLTVGSVDLTALTQAQHDAAEGKFAAAMAGYLQFLAKRYDDLAADVKRRTELLRRAFSAEERHGKLANNLASLAVGFEYFLTYAVEAGAISVAEADALWRRMWNAFASLAAMQDQHQRQEDPSRDVIQLLRSAEANGEIWLQSIDDPNEKDPLNTQPGSFAMRIGWKTADGEWRCVPDQLYSAIRTLKQRQREEFPLDKETLWERLAQKGYTKTERDRPLCKQRVQGKLDRFICIPPETFERVAAEEESVDVDGGDADGIIPWEQK
jgi:hypothetical protein